MRFDWKLSPPCNGKVYSQKATFGNDTYRNVHITISKVTVGGKETYEMHLSSYGMDRGCALKLSHKLAEAMSE